MDRFIPNRDSHAAPQPPLSPAATAASPVTAPSPWQAAVVSINAGREGIRRRSLASLYPWVVGSSSSITNPQSLQSFLLRSELESDPDGANIAPAAVNAGEGDAAASWDSPSAGGGRGAAGSSGQAHLHRSPLRSALRDASEAVSAQSLAQLGGSSRAALLEKRKPRRKISRLPFKVLDAPGLADDFYLNLLSWSSQNVLAVGLGSEVYLWNGLTASVSTLTGKSEEGVGAVGWSDRGAHLAVGGVSGGLSVFDVASGRETRKFGGHAGRVGTVAFAGHLLASGGRDRCLYIRDVRTPRDFEARLVEHTQDITGLRWSPDWSLLASGSNDNTVCCWATAQIRTTDAEALRLNDNNQQGKGRPLWKFTQHRAAAKALAFSPFDDLLATGGGTNDRCIRVFSTKTGEMLQCVDSGAQVCNLHWSISTNEIASTHGYNSNSLAVWKYPSMLKLANLTGHQQRVMHSALSPDGQTIATGAGDETLRFWSIFPPKHDDNMQPQGRLGLDSAGRSSIVGLR